MDINIKSWLNSGIFAITNVSTSQSYLTHSLCMFDSLVRHIRLIRQNSHPIKELNVDLDRVVFSILETNLPDDKDRRLALQQHIDTFPNGVLNRKASVVYKVDMRFIHGRIHVQLRSRNNKRFTVGVFRKLKEANKFIQDSYPSKDINKIVYSSNLLTREFRRLDR